MEFDEFKRTFLEGTENDDIRSEVENLIEDYLVRAGWPEDYDTDDIVMSTIIGNALHDSETEDEFLEIMADANEQN